MQKNHACISGYWTSLVRGFHILLSLVEVILGHFFRHYYFLWLMPQLVGGLNLLIKHVMIQLFFWRILIRMGKVSLGFLCKGLQIFRWQSFFQIDDDEVRLTLHLDHIILTTTQYHWDSKLIDARFPPYQRAIPPAQDKRIYVNKDQLRKALVRTMILANERFKAVLLSWQEGELRLGAYNQEDEEAVEIVTADVQGEVMKIGVNAHYLLDVLGHLPDGQIELSFSQPDSSISVQSSNDKNYQYLIMPMKL